MFSFFLPFLQPQQRLSPTSVGDGNYQSLVQRLTGNTHPLTIYFHFHFLDKRSSLFFSINSTPLSVRRSQPLRFSDLNPSDSPPSPAYPPPFFVRDKLPDSTLSYFNSIDELQTVPVSDLISNKKVILLVVPEAFTPTCSQKHVPGFTTKAAELKVKGVDTIACISVNDAFVMKAWKGNLKIEDEVLLLSDGKGDLTRAMRCRLDLSDKPVVLGVSSRRYAMYVENGVVKVLNFEESGAFNVSSAEDMLNDQ